MKKLLSLLLCGILLFGCSKYDDSAIQGDLNNLKDRVSKLEALCSTMNTNLASLTTIVDALQKQVTILEVEPLTNGYKIHFSDGNIATIQNGKNSGDAPDIGVEQDTDGIYYWMLNGEWLTDAQGNKIQAQGTNGINGKSAYELAVEKGYSGTLDEWLASLHGVDGTNGKSAYELAVAKGYQGTLDEWLTALKGTDGKDGQDGKDGINGTTPQLKIENNYWHLSYDNGKTWTQLSKATGENGKNGTSCIFKSVTEDTNNVYFQLTDNTQIIIPKSESSKFSITFDNTDIAILNAGETKTVSYTITNATDATIVKTISQHGWKASVDPTSTSAGIITITAPNPITESEILVFVNDGSYHTIMASLNCMKGQIIIADNSYDIGVEGGIQQIKLTTNLDYTVDIPEDAKSWLSLVPKTRALRDDIIIFNIAANQGIQRHATVALRDEHAHTLQTIIFRQLGNCTEIYVEKKGELMNILANYDYSNIESIKITGEINDVDVIGIRNMSNLRDLDISGTNLMELLKSSFQELTNLKKVVLPNTLTSIGERAFKESGLQSIEIPASVETIENNAFEGCTALTTVTFEKGSQLKTIGSGAFQASSLQSIEIPASVDTIESAAFYNCEALTSVTFEKGSQLKTIGSGAFQASGLQSIEILASVETIENNAFKGCKALTTVTFEKGSQLKTIQGGYDENSSIYYGAFSNCISLTSIEIPASVDTIESTAFKGCKALTTVTFEKGSQLKTIHGGYCKDSSIHFGTFSDCTSLTSIEIPASVETIEFATFRGFKALTTVTFEKGSQLKTIERYAFETSGLQSIEIPASVETIEFYAFSKCKALTAVTFENGSQLKTIEKDAFETSGLQSIEIPASVETIEKAAFYNCEALTSVTFEKGSQLKIIEGDYRYEFEGAFSYLPNLKTMDMSACTQVEDIGEMTFANCSSLQLFKIGTVTPPNAYYSSFSGLPTFKILRVPAESVETYKKASGWNKFSSISALD